VLFALNLAWHTRNVTPLDWAGEMFELGAYLVVAVLIGWLAEEIARCHHEWWDGTGYPDQLRGEDIPISGRIVAVADVYDALTPRPPLQTSLDDRTGGQQIVSLSGTHFDPAVVDAFQRLDHRQLSRAATPPRRGARLRVVA
jgi:HD-GYP domain-containing protein (c-di-GMP phosphodiesterase class II)